MFEFLKGYDDFAVLVCPDHPTPLNIKTHSSNPVPFLIYNSKDEKNSGVDVFTEANAKKTGEYIEKGFTTIKILQIKYKIFTPYQIFIKKQIMLWNKASFIKLIPYNTIIKAFYIMQKINWDFF